MSAMSESREMYLETILILSKTQQDVHAVHICEYMSFSRPSVSRALKYLKQDGYINVDGNRHVTLTEKGLRIAQSMYERHNLLTDCLVSLGVSRESAVEDACRIEHVISAETFEALKKHALEFAKQRNGRQ